MTDALGNVVERYAFRPFGERVVLENPDNDYTGVALQGVTPGLTRGFTGHEHIDGVGLIHMNGRVYDPRLGRFLSADPHVQFLDEPRGYNRYAYVQNNPLKYSDPSGYFLKEVFTAAVSVFIYAVSVATMGPAGAAFASGFATSIGLGADLKTALQNGALAGATAFAFHQVGSYADARSAHPGVGGAGDAAWSSGGWKKVVAHATVGGTASEIAGGSFRDGAIGAGFSQFASPRAGVSKIKGDHAAIKQVTMAAVIGGTGSALSGGRFANGAATAAFGWLFNENRGEVRNRLDKAGRPKPGSGFVIGPTGYWQKQIGAEVELMYGRNAQMSLAPIPGNTSGCENMCIAIGTTESFITGDAASTTIENASNLLIQHPNQGVAAGGWVIKRYVLPAKIYNTAVEFRDIKSFCSESCGLDPYEYQHRFGAR